MYEYFGVVVFIVMKLRKYKKLKTSNMFFYVVHKQKYYNNCNMKSSMRQTEICRIHLKFHATLSLITYKSTKKRENCVEGVV